MKTPNTPIQAIPLPEQYKKLIETPASSSSKKTKNPIVNPSMPSISLDPTPKKLQEVIQQDFPTIPTNKRGANRFNRGPFRKSTQSTRGKLYVKPLTTSDPI
jgi:hypothetical protein